MTRAAISRGITCSQSERCRYSTPSESSTRATMYGVQCRPSFARVWKDDAISSGETSLDPSVIEGTREER